jgi:hypothetical protein
VLSGKPPLDFSFHGFYDQKKSTDPNFQFSHLRATQQFFLPYGYGLHALSTLMQCKNGVYVYVYVYVG